jgi:hypothetical protein
MALQQISTVAVGTDITQQVGYLIQANDRLGAFDLIFENNGPNTASILLKQYVGTNVAGNVSGYAQLGGIFTVAPASLTTASGAVVGVQGGSVTKHLVVVGKQLGIFGSGSTTVNVSVAIRNSSDLRGASFDFVPTPGHQGWGYDPGTNVNALRPAWGTPPDASNLPLY